MMISAGAKTGSSGETPPTLHAGSVAETADDGMVASLWGEQVCGPCPCKCRLKSL